MKCRSCEFGRTVFAGKRVVCRCELLDGEIFLDGEKERTPLVQVCPWVRVVYRRGSAYEVLYPEYYCGMCRSYPCTDPCPRVKFRAPTPPSPSAASAGAAGGVA